MSLSFSVECEADLDLIESPQFAIWTFPHLGILAGSCLKILEYG